MNVGRLLLVWVVTNAEHLLHSYVECVVTPLHLMSSEWCCIVWRRSRLCLCQVVRKVRMEPCLYLVHVVLSVYLIFSANVVYICSERDLSSGCGADARKWVENRVVECATHVVWSVPIGVVLCGYTHCTAIENELILIWIRLMEKWRVLNNALSISCHMHQHYPHLRASLDRCYFTPSRGSVVWVKWMWRGLISVFACMRVPMKHRMSVNLASSSRDIYALTFVNGNDIVWCFGLVFDFLARSVVCIRLVYAVCARMNCKYHVSLNGWTMNNGLVYWVCDTRIINTVVCENCVVVRPYPRVFEIALHFFELCQRHVYFVATQSDLFVHHILGDWVLVDVVVIVLIYSVPDSIYPLVIEHACCLHIFRADIDNDIPSMHFLSSYEFHEVISWTYVTVGFCVIVLWSVWEASPELVAALW